MSMIGKTLGHYSVSALLGMGGMGEVYQAKDQKLGRDVAIKVLPEEFAKDADRVARFQREAKLLASLNHPNIAAIYGLEESDDTHFLVLELIEGETLADRLKRGAIPVEESLKLGLQIAEALEAAHEKGVIHRDLKPANIKVTPDGKVKVLDFGLAKAFTGEQEEVNLSNSPTLSDAATQQGVILGTAAYMSPDQALGKPVDKRADVWAFGCVLYELLTGKAAFSGRDVTDILAAVIRADPEWKSLPENLHWRLKEVLERCLEKEAKERYSGVSDARVDIQKVLADPDGVLVKPEAIAEHRTGIRTILPWIAAIILVGIIVGLAVWQLRTPESAVPTSFYYQLPEGQQYSNSSRPVVAIAPDGRQSVYCTNGGLYRRSINELDARLIDGTANGNAFSPFFSPDGKWIAYFSLADNRLKKIAIEGGLVTDLCNVDKAIYGSGWWTDDKILFSTNASPGVMQIPDNGGTPELLIDKKEALALLGPQMLPDGKSVLFTKMDSVQNQSIMVRSLESGETKEITAGFLARYLPSGYLIYTKGESVLTLNANLFSAPFDAEKLEITGNEVPIGITVSGIMGCRFSVSDSGTLVYIPERSSDSGAGNTFVWVDRDGNEEPLGAPAGGYGMPKISHDGKQVALTVAGDNFDIYIWDLAVKKPMRRLTFDKSRDLQSIWMPEDKQILFWSSRGSEFGGIYRKSADGTGEAELLVSAPDRQLFPYAFSKDGKTLVLADTPDAVTQSNISTFSMEGDHTLKPLLANESGFITHPQISPDGKWIAYTVNDSSTTNVYVRPFPDVNNGRWQVTTNDARSPLWSPDSQELFYYSGAEQSVMAAMVETQPTFSIIARKRLFSGSPYLMGGVTPGIPWDIHPNGMKFLMMKQPGVISSTESGAQPIINILNWDEELKERVPVD